MMIQTSNHHPMLRNVRTSYSALKNTQLHLLPSPISAHFHNLPQNLLPVCSSTHSLAQTKQAHAVCILHGLLPSSITLSAALILRYAAFQVHKQTLYSVFHQSLPYAPFSTFFYNTTIRAHVNLGLYYDGLVFYNDMVKKGVKCDDYTYPFVFKLCSEGIVKKKGLEVHCAVVKAGFDEDVFVNNTLMLFYGCCGDLRDVEKVFDEMRERDVVSWNTIIRSFSDSGLDLEVMFLFKEMMSLGSGFKPNAVSVVSVLPVCGALVDGDTVCGIHCYAVKVGLESNVTIGNALIDSYGKCGEVNAATRIFRNMANKNDVSWNVMITSFSYRGYYREALDSFRMMINEGVVLNSVTVSSILPVMVELGLLYEGREIHAFSMKMQLDIDIFVANSLIDMYAKSGRPISATNVFDKMDVRNVVSWNTMIANFAQNELEAESIALVRKMQIDKEVPNAVTFTNVLPACARLCALRLGKEIHARLIRTESSSELFVSNALTDMYGKCYKLNLARNVFDNSSRDEVSYNILIVGYSQTNECSNSIDLFSEMGALQMKYDNISFMGALSACANVSAIKPGREIHAFAMRRSFDSHICVANSLLDMYIKSGRIHTAQKVFDKIPKKDSASWNTLIMGYGMLGELDTAINLFDAMKHDTVEYDSVSYIAVLSACSHGGLVEHGRRYFNDMIARGIKPSQMHYSCMVDILGRSGLIDEAIELIKSLPIEPDANVWGALLGACRIHGYIELGCWAAEHLLRLKPGHSGYYTLLSNMYAEAGKWELADKVRELMKIRGVQKNPGWSWV